MSTSSEDHSDKECPLCMEVLELDDVDFYPCKCEYQICRFCWHRIRTDENGLCPACRQPYPEDPVNFKPRSSVDIQRHKNEKKLKKQAEKMRISETRQHLANYRVLQKNLVYVVGLSQRVADPEILKKPEYFGRYGKIVKVVTSVAPSIHPHQHLPPSHTAYVTYKKVEEALRAIQGVNNAYLDGRLVKASLGTTKYCSSFLQSRKCFKPECMYLHENAEPEISFTKEDMHFGKHTEYEKKLIETVLNRPPPPNPTVANIIEKALEKPSQKPTTKTISQWDAANDASDELDEPAEQFNEPINEPHEGSLSDNGQSKEDVERDASDNTSCKSNDSTSVEDPAPSDGVNNIRAESNSHDRKWPERDGNSIAQSHSPPTDPEATETEKDSLNMLDEMMAKLGTSEPEMDYNYQGIPAPAEHNEAPAPLENWQTLLGLSPQKSITEPAFDFLPQSFMSVAPQPVVPAVSNTKISNTPPPGISRFGSDDDLGFDPFAESSKGLSMLLQEEREMPLLSQYQMQQNNLLLLQQKQIQQQQQKMSVMQQLQQFHTPLVQPPLGSLWPTNTHTRLSTNLARQSQLKAKIDEFKMQDSPESLIYEPLMALSRLQIEERALRDIIDGQQRVQQLQQQQQQQQQQNNYMMNQASMRQSSLLQMFQRPQQENFMSQMFVPTPPGLSVPNRPSVSQQQKQQQQIGSHLPFGSSSQSAQSTSSGSQQVSNNSNNNNNNSGNNSQSMQEMFKALLPNVNVRFMDDSAMSRWSHENSLRSNSSHVVPPPPGFSSVMNR